MSLYKGDITSGLSFVDHFNTRTAAQTPTTFSGTVTLGVLSATATLATTTGLAFTTDLGGKVGLNQITVNTQTVAVYPTATDYSVVVTAGTVDGVSVVGAVVSKFSIENRKGATDGTAIANAYASINTDTDAILAQMAPATTLASVYTDTTALLVRTASQTSVNTSYASLSADTTNILASVGNIAQVGSPAYQAPSTIVYNTGTLTSGTITNVDTANGIYQVLTGTATYIDLVYKYELRSDEQANSLEYKGRLSGVDDSVSLRAYDWTASAYGHLATIAGVATSNDTTLSQKLVGKYTSTVANGLGSVPGLVWVQLAGGSTTPVLNIDQLVIGKTNNSRTVGYSDGAVWVKAAGNAGTETYTNGTADNPCPWANAQTIATALGISRFRILNGETVTLTGATAGKSLIGKNWNLALGGQDISGSYIEGATVTGIGSGTTSVTFRDCSIGAATIPPAILDKCGIGASSGTFTATGGTASQYVFVDCFSLVPGSGTPALTFVGGTTSRGVNIRRWSGGTNITLDSVCTLTLEVVTGGGQTIATGGANVEVRGICRAITLNTLNGNTCQICAVTGPITLAGSAATVNIYGACGVVTDNSGSTVTNNAVKYADVADILTDTGTTLDGLIKTLGTTVSNGFNSTINGLNTISATMAPATTLASVFTDTTALLARTASATSVSTSYASLAASMATLTAIVATNTDMDSAIITLNTILADVSSISVSLSTTDIASIATQTAAAISGGGDTLWSDTVTVNGVLQVGAKVCIFHAITDANPFAVSYTDTNGVYRFMLNAGTYPIVVSDDDGVTKVSSITVT